MRDAIIYWKMAIVKAAGKSMIALLTSIVATLNGVEWGNFTPTQKFIAVAAGAGAMWTVIDAFLDNTMSELKKSQGTQFFYKPTPDSDNPAP